MFSNIVFSLNIVMPIFLMMLIGYLMKKKGFFTEELKGKITHLVFYYALTASIFRDVASADMSEVFDIRFVLFGIISLVGMFLLTWGFCALLIKDKSRIAAAVHGGFRGNYVYIGMVLLRNLLNTDTLTSSVMIVTFVVPIYNVLAIILLTHYDPNGKKISVRDQLIKILTNPMILAVLAGLPFSIMHIAIPSMFDKTLSYLAQMASPLALLLIGASLQPETFIKKPKEIILGSLFKVVVAPLICTVLAIVLGFRGEELITLYIFHAVPSATNSYIMTKQMGGDGELGAGIIMATSICSTLTITIGIFLLRSLSLL